ncbi:hypothetical protein V8F20_000768 [Naviculisporaceae sp. PSN 640]
MTQLLLMTIALPRVSFVFVPSTVSQGKHDGVHRGKMWRLRIRYARDKLAPYGCSAARLPGRQGLAINGFSLHPNCVGTRQLASGRRSEGHALGEFSRAVVGQRVRATSAFGSTKPRVGGCHSAEDLEATPTTIHAKKPTQELLWLPYPNYRRVDGMIGSSKIEGPQHTVYRFERRDAVPGATMYNRHEERVKITTTANPKRTFHELWLFLYSWLPGGPFTGVPDRSHRNQDVWPARGQYRWLDPTLPDIDLRFPDLARLSCKSQSATASLLPPSTCTPKFLTHCLTDWKLALLCALLVVCVLLHKSLDLNDKYGCDDLMPVPVCCVRIMAQLTYRSLPSDQWIQQLSCETSWSSFARPDPEFDSSDVSLYGVPVRGHLQCERGS